MTPLSYPIALILDGKSCLVVGGGEIADGKLDALLRSGANVTVVSPQARPRIAEMAANGRITWRSRPYRADDLAGAALVIAATDDNALNAEVVTDARARGILAQAVDYIPYCDFYAVATVRRGDLQLGISTNGRSPAFAHWLRERLDADLPAAYGDLLAALGDVRDRLKAAGPIPEYEHWQAAITPDVLDTIAAGDHVGAREQIYARVVLGVPATHAGAAS